MMLRTSVVFAVALLLAGCSYGSSQTVTLAEPGGIDVERLHPVQSISLKAPEGVQGEDIGPMIFAFALSDDGQYLLSVSSTREYQGEAFTTINWVDVHDATTGDRIVLDGLNKPEGESVISGGFLGVDTFYLESRGPLTRRPSETASAHVQVFNVHSRQPLASLPYSGVSPGRGPYLYVAEIGSVVHWETGGRYPAQVDHRLGIALVTEDGAVFSGSMNGVVTMHNPVRDELKQWRSGRGTSRFLVSGKGEYLVTLRDDYRCGVWRVSEPERLAQCPRSLGSKGEGRAAAMHPEQPVFALAWGETVRVFSIEPFGLVDEIVIPSPVQGLHMTGDRLVIESRQGLHIWDIETSALVATADVPIASSGNVRVSKNGVVAVLLDNDPDDPENGIRPVWIYNLP